MRAVSAKSRSPADAEASHNFEAEQAVLGTLLTNNALVARMREIVSPEHFADAGHVALFNAILMLVDRGGAASPATLARWAAAQDGPNFDARYIASLVNVSLPGPEALEMARHVQRHYFLRKVQSVLAGDDGVRDIGEGLREALAELGATNRAALDLAAHRAARWSGKEVPTIPMLVDGLVPDQFVTLLAGDGGAGKSMLMQTVATCVASTNKPFLGRATRHGVAVYLTGEDPENVLHSRQARICEALGVPMEEVGDRLIIRSMSESDFMLFAEGKATSMMRDLEAEVASLQASLLAIDSATVVFADNEIERRMVTRFLRGLNAMAQRRQCAIMLAAHTSRSSDSSVAGIASGSTSWTFQARGALRLDAIEGGAKLIARKGNYFKPGLEVELRWTDDGVLVAKDDGGTVGRIERDSLTRERERKILEEVGRRWQENDPLSASRQAGHRYLPQVMARLGAMRADHAEHTMVGLLDRRLIVSEGRTKTRQAGLRTVENPVPHDPLSR